MPHTSRILVWCAVLVVQTGSAHAYRPFDGTDADIAEPGHVELELGLLALEAGRNHLMVESPSLVFNVGLPRRVELVFEGRHEMPVLPIPELGHSVLADLEVGPKILLRKGRLQGELGPSIALEVHALLPEIGGSHGIGLSVSPILSFAAKSWIVHGTLDAELNREVKPEFGLHGIVELRADHALRPVLELGGTWEPLQHCWDLTGLAGLLWQENEDVTLDLALVARRSETGWTGILRFGLTLEMPRAEPAE